MGDMLNDTGIATAEEPTMRKPYVDAGLTKLVAGIDAYLSEKFTYGIGNSIKKVIEVEAPVEKGLLFNAVCRSYGTDAGAIDVLRKNEAILKGIPHKETRYGGSVFVWREDQDPTRYFEYRVAEPPAERFIGRVSYEELSALLYDVVMRESPLDVDLMIDIAIDESGYTGPRSKARSVLRDVFDKMAGVGLVCADEAGDVSILRPLDDVLANGTGSDQVSKPVVVTGEVKKASAVLDARPSENRAFDAHAASIRRTTGEEAGDNPAPVSLSEKMRAQSEKPAAPKRQRKSGAVKATGPTAGAKLANLGEEHGVLSNVGDAKLYVPEAPAGGDVIMQRYMDPQTKARLIGGTVAHQKFGNGKIKKIDGNRVIIAFGSDLKQFVYPTIFLGGIVVLVDREV